MAWITPVTNRASAYPKTTHVDMNRIVGNAIVLGYVTAKVTYTAKDIVLADEWESLIEFAQIIDPTITQSTHFTNLNKIEQAFDDAHSGMLVLPGETLKPSETLVPNRRTEV